MLDTADNDDTIYSSEDYFEKLTNPICFEPQIRRFEQLQVGEKSKFFYIQYEQYDTLFYDFFFQKDGENIFLGRFLRNVGKDMKFKVNDKMILIYETDTMGRITKVINLYYIEDVMSFVGTEKDALKTFDPSIDTSDLLSPNASLVDYVANNRLKKTKNLSRFVYYGD